ncbi:unnamed protein product [Mytilus coruscus]|uniref:Core-binding (CB) domain-containing protein n=1 Tax=Mytilus coruscus TaxID=42192 RepID=A0A6J8DDX4_MYTCO|nr:unnamed protein product [Mytilus coruscus]
MNRQVESSHSKSNERNPSVSFRFSLSSCIELIPNARLYMRPIQLHLLSFWRPACQEFKTQVLVTQHLKSHLIWWLNSANTLKGRSLQPQQTCITITTNASKTGYEVPVSDSPDSAFVAQETLVPGITSTIDRLHSQSPDTIRPSLSTKVPSFSSVPRGIQSDCLASFDRSFQAEGFSKEARNLLSASWRKETQKDYSAKFKKNCSWCSTREINPHNATLNQVADYLAHLFENGLQYRTIAGYRSILSNVLPQVDNTAVGQHPYITRLIKGVFNSRPPTTKLLPEWDLQLVLTLLQKEPFEPIENIDLKQLTFKTVFLISITTFRRCSDLLSLRVNHSFMRIQQKGITLIRCGLAKQDRQNHINSKIVVPAFTDNKKLDPATCLLQSLERTKKFRSSLNKDQQRKLFLSICEPHKPVTSQTISKWIVQVI